MFSHPQASKTCGWFLLPFELPAILCGCAPELFFETANKVRGGGKVAFIGDLLDKQVGGLQQRRRTIEPLVELPFAGWHTVLFGKLALEGRGTHIASLRPFCDCGFGVGELFLKRFKWIVSLNSFV